MSEEKEQGKFIDTKTGRYLNFTVYLALRVLIIIGILFLLCASIFVKSYMWGGGTYPGPIWDAWGAKIYPGFFVVRDFAIAILFVASIIYPIRLWLDDQMTIRPSDSTRNFHLYAGFLLPSIVTFGDPLGMFYYDYIDFSLTGVVAPLYNFCFSGVYGVASTFTITSVLSPFIIWGFICFILAAAQISAAKIYEISGQGLAIVLIPVLINLGLTLFYFGGSLPLVITGYGFSPFNYSEFAQISYMLPFVSIGVLVRAIGVKRNNHGL
ncbi:MAG: hypothetical protein ACFFEK_03045 [Candidatus Thorarchaeota archaeon]